MTKKSKELIKVEFSRIEHEVVQTVDARELHKELGSKRKFTNWIEYQINKCGLEINKDYIKIGNIDVTKNSVLEGTKKCTAIQNQIIFLHWI